jgi:hypothetical protein
MLMGSLFLGLIFCAGIIIVWGLAAIALALTLETLRELFKD